MGQFDNLKSITMLFTGAFLVSFGVIAFLNIEIQSRSNHGVKIRNENLFEVLGRKISQMISTLKERNSYRRSILYQIFVQENTTRTPLRKLQSFNEDAASVDNMAKHYYNQTHRHLRHVKKIKRLTEILLRGKNNSREHKFDLENKYELKGEEFVTAFNNISSNRTLTQNAYLNSTKKNNLEETLKVHENCYTTNDVLEIIALTCLVNFTFWFLIIFCVNILTRNQKIWKLDSTESLTSVKSGSDYELDQRYSKKDEILKKDSQNLTAYVNSLANEHEMENPECEVQEHNSWSHLKPKMQRKSYQDKINTEKWIRQRFTYLSNIFFGTVSLDNLKPVKKKNFVSRNKNNKIVNSFSMEDLIF